MNKFSERSKRNLETCKAPLQQLMNEVIKDIDCSVICGYRGKKAQEQAFTDGKSKARFGQSKHNDYPSSAVDVVPYPLDWMDIGSFNRLGDVVIKKADELGIEIKWGKHFKGLADYPHYELVDNND